MIILLQLNHQLNHLKALLRKLNIEQYTYKSKYLANATIGGHTRHIIELLQCAVNGYSNNFIDYVNRSRNLVLEYDMNEALLAMEKLSSIAHLSDKAVTLFCEDDTTIITTFYRELVYNVEHIIHHLALIKVSLVELEAVYLIDENFGYAYSTITYKQQLQQV